MLPFENASKVVGAVDENGYFRLFVTYSTKDTDAMREMLALLHENQYDYGSQPADVVERTEDYVVLKVIPDV